LTHSSRSCIFEFSRVHPIFVPKEKESCSMGLIFDAGAARLYEAWYQSPQGRAMERLVKSRSPTSSIFRRGKEFWTSGAERETISIS